MMVKKAKLYQPVYNLFVSEIEKGFLLLDETSRNEVVRFIISQQNKTGAFTDRAGNSDLYYSLFGVWLAKALKMQEQQSKLKQYISTFQKKEEKIVNRFSLLLISMVLEENSVNKPSFFELMRWVLKGGKNLNPAYRFFLFMLSFDALFGQNRILNFFLKHILKFYNPPEELPCSFYSALLLAKFWCGVTVKKETEVLFTYFENGKGFKVFREQENADLLSTAVALFTLKNTQADLRIVTPDCLNLVDESFINGAFLSGDGDSFRDVEYTFYGLLTLGTLS